MRLFYKMKKLNNKGFSLVELVVAIALFAIIITPVMNSFITSARVNRDARKIMIATDVAQNIVEGYSEKTFELLTACYMSVSSSDLSGTGAFTTINGSKFNVSSNWIDLSAATGISHHFDEIKTDVIKFDGVSYYTVNIVSDNSITNSMHKPFEEQVVSHGITDQQLYYYYQKGVEADGSDCLYDGVAFMAYTNIEADTGYVFNATVDIIPVCSMAEHDGLYKYTPTKNKYFTYVIKVSLYDALDPADASATDFGEPLVTVLGGIPNK